MQSWSPRQIDARLALARRGRIRQMSEDLSVGLLAARGDQKAIDKQMKAWAQE